MQQLITGKLKEQPQLSIINYQLSIIETYGP